MMTRDYLLGIRRELNATKIEQIREFRLPSIQDSENMGEYINARLQKHKRFLNIGRLFVLLILTDILALVLAFNISNNWVQIVCYAIGGISVCGCINSNRCAIKYKISTGNIEVIQNCHIIETHSILDNILIYLETPFGTIIELGIDKEDILWYRNEYCDLIKIKQGNKNKYVVNLVEYEKFYNVVKTK